MRERYFHECSFANEASSKQEEDCGIRAPVTPATPALPADQTPEPDFFIIRLAEQIFRLIFGLAEFLRKLQNSAENTAEQYKFG